MPLYEYECEAKGHKFELIRKFSDPPLDRCVKCGGKVRRLLSAPAIAFKGTGWYVTDYARKGSGGNGAGSESKSSEPSKAPSSSASDKPSPKKESPSGDSSSKSNSGKST